LTLLVGWQEGHPACKKLEWWGTGICLERDADLHMAQLMPLPLTVSCFSKIEIGLTFLVPAHPDGPGKRAVCVCLYNIVALNCRKLTDLIQPQKVCGQTPSVLLGTIDQLECSDGQTEDE